MIKKAIFNKAPLAPNRFAELPLGSIEPLGELRERLEAQAQGLGGHLTEVWPSLMNNAWMGGDGDDWERGPYYLDGLIALAYTLKDEKLIDLANRFVEWILASQDEDGFFGPKTNRGWWPRMVALKALMQHFTATADRRVLPFMMKYFRYQYEHLSEQPLELWASARASENLLSVLWLYNITGEKALLRLCDRLIGQALDWTGLFSAFPYNTDLKRTMPWKELKPRLKDNGDIHSQAWFAHQSTHVVNLAMGLKYPALEHALHGGIKQDAAVFAGYEKLMKTHGVATGMFTGDEHLSGASPSQGTETCAVAEMLFTQEVLMGLLDDARIGDIWEMIGYNAMPAALSRDGWTHQYDQQVNQIRISRQKRNWYNNGDDSNVFGLEPNFGCCTANLHQGLPKFAAHLWMATEDGGLVCQSPAPCMVRFRAGGQRVKVEVGGNYPHDGAVSIRVQVASPAAFPIVLRIPAWAEGASVRVGEEQYEARCGSFVSIHRLWEGGEVIELTLPMVPRIKKWYHQSISVYKGPLLYALPIRAIWEKDGDAPYADRFAAPASPWNYALYPSEHLCAAGDGSIEVCGAPVPGWQEKNGSAAPPPVLPKTAGDKQVLRLVPYAQSELRIAQFPQGV